MHDLTFALRHTLEPCKPVSPMPGPVRYTVSYFSSSKDRDPSPDILSWPELCETLSEPDVRQEKDGPAWSPVTYLPGATRGVKGVDCVNLAVFDIDKVSVSDLAELSDRLEGYAFILHSTFSHCKENPSLRLIVPLANPIPAKDWKDAQAQIADDLRVPFDPATTDASRIFYLPSCPDPSNYEFESELGRAYHWIPTGGRVSHDSGPSSDSFDSLDVALVRRNMADRLSLAKSEDNPEHVVLLERALKGEPLANSGSRNTRIYTFMCLFVACVPLDCSFDLAYEVIRPSIQGIEPDPVEDWVSHARDSYERAMASRAAYMQSRREEKLQLKERIALAFPKSGGPATPPSGDEWRGLLIYDQRKSGEVLRANYLNAFTILEHDPDIKGCIRWNTVKGIITTRGIVEGVNPDNLPSELHLWLQRHYDISVPTSQLREAISHVAQNNRFSPVVEYLDSLTWDGTPRIGSWLVDYLGADDEPITRTMSSKFLIAACARAYNPGCQVDTALILKGPQGNGKTSILRILGGEWYVCLSEKLGDKDSRMKAASGWIVEIAELAGMTAADSRAIKSFLDQTDDIFRPPYGASMLTFKRHCVFTGTTNEDSYLLDQTGARRFWVVESDKPVALDKALADRDQLWAEARDAYKSGAIWWATPDEVPLFEERAATAQEESPTSHIEAAIEKWWARLNKSHREREPGWTVPDLLCDVLGLEARDIKWHHPRAMTKSLENLEWHKKQHWKDRKWYWNPPLEWHGRETAKIGVVK